MNKVEVSPNIWQWVFQTGVLEGLKNKHDFEKWARQEASPTFNQLEKFSKATHIPLGYFFLQTPPSEKCAFLEYRTVDSLALRNPSHELQDTVRHMENVQEWMRNYLIDIGSERLGYVGAVNKDNSVESTVIYVRDLLALKVDWYAQSKSIDDSFKHLRQAISNAGVLVMLSGIVGANTHLALDINEFRAFTLIDEFAPLIFINSTDSDSGKLFSLLHEFIHVCIGESSLYNANEWNDINPLEVLCNAVTAEILLPESQFQREWGKTKGDAAKRVEEIASHFRCGRMVVARRALDKKIISKDEYNAMLSEAKFNFGKKKGSGGDYYKTNAVRLDRRFLFALDASVREGRTLYTDAYRLTNTNRSTFDTLIMEMRGERV
jgi:Zn-dependent peptidase ImmA (M78 family)